MPPPETQSTLASWSATIVRALDAEGFGGAAVAERAGISAAMLADPGARIPRSSLTRLWRLAVAESGNEAFGLVAARHTLQTTFHALGYAVLASSTLREACERIVRYRRLIGDILRLRVDDVGDRTRFVVDVSAGRGIVPPEALDAIVAVTARQARLLSGGQPLNPLAVSLERAAPADPAPWLRALHAPVSFGQKQNFLEYARADVDRRLPAANAELARQNDEAVQRYLARLDDGRVLAKARQAILETLPGGAPSKTAVAKRLALSPRSLQRMLDAEGSSFKELLADARLQLARDYLDEGRLPVTEIAFVLGFADTSAFSRAFRRWTGMAPSDYAARPRD